MAIKDCIKEARLQKGYSQEELGKMIGVAKQTIQKYENGIISNIPSDKVEALAKALGTTPIALMGWEEKSTTISLSHFSNIRPIETKKIPLLGKIACGKPTFAEEQFETFIDASADLQADFCLQTKGDSMINARIYDGDIVFIRQQQEVENGQIAAVIINDEATLKRVSYFPEKSMLILKPENPAYSDLVYIGDELENVHILGKAVAFQSLIK